MNIDFVSAENGKINLYEARGFGHYDREVHVAETAEEIAEILVTYGFGSIYFSSSMDFASEYGFETDDAAEIMFEAGYELAKEMFVNQ